MTVTVAGVRFDSHDPSPMPQHPLDPGRRFLWLDNAERFKFEGQPPTDEGGLVCYVALDSEDSRDRYTGRMQSIIGSIVTVEFGGGAFIGGLYLNAVQTDWKAAKGNTGQGLLTARFSFGQDNRDQIDTDFVHVKVYTSDTLEDETGPSWVEQTSLRCINAVESFFPLIGSARLIQYANEGDTIPDIVGKYVRLDFPDDISNPTVWAPQWYGFVRAPSHIPDSETVRRVFVNWECPQISAELQVWLSRWYETNKSGSSPTTVFDPGRILAPNTYVDGQDRGGTASIRTGVTTNVHDRTQVGLPWRYNQYFETVLKGAFGDTGSQTQSEIDITISGQDQILQGFMVADYEGLPVSDMLADALKFGSGCYVTVSGVDPNTVIDFEIRSVLPTDINSASVVYPATAKTNTVDLDLVEIGDDWNWVIDDSNVVDEAYLWGSETWYMGTFGTTDDRGSAAFVYQFEPFWDASKEGDFDSLVDNTDLRDVLSSPDMATVWRVFKLRSDWRGETYEDSSTRLLTSRIVSTNDVNGTDGETGELIPDPIGGVSFSPAAVQLTRTLPIDMRGAAGLGPGQAWVGSPSETPDQIVGPLVASGAGSGEGGFFRIEDRGGVDERWYLVDMQFQVNPENQTVTLGTGPDDAKQIRDWIAAGQEIAFTLGFLAPQTFRVSWRRDPANRPRGIGRTIEHRDEELFLRYALNNTVTTIDDGVPQYTLAQELGESPTIRANDNLALLQMYHANPAYALQFSKPGTIDVTTDYDPGTVITQVNQVTLGTIDTSNTTLHVTSRRWDFDITNTGTVYDCTQASLDAALTYIQDTRAIANKRLFGIGDWVNLARVY